MTGYSFQNLSEHMKRDRKLYSDFLPRFSALIEIGNWSQDVEKSMGLIRTVEKVYKRIHADNSDPFHNSLRKVHEKWWQQGQPGEVRVYRFTTQYLKPAVYRVKVSCDDDGGNVHFSRTKDVIQNSDNLEDVAQTIIREAISMFQED